MIRIQNRCHSNQVERMGREMLLEFLSDLADGYSITEVFVNSWRLPVKVKRFQPAARLALSNLSQVTAKFLRQKVSRSHFAGAWNRTR